MQRSGRIKTRKKRERKIVSQVVVEREGVEDGASLWSCPK